MAPVCAMRWASRGASVGAPSGAAPPDVPTDLNPKATAPRRAASTGPFRRAPTARPYPLPSRARSVFWSIKTMRPLARERAGSAGSSIRAAKLGYQATSASTPPSGVEMLLPKAAITNSRGAPACRGPEASDRLRPNNWAEPFPRCQTLSSMAWVRTCCKPNSRKAPCAHATARRSPSEPAGRGPMPTASSCNKRQATSLTRACCINSRAWSRSRVLNVVAEP